MLKIDDLAGVVFAGLSALVIEDVKDEDEFIRVVARTRDEPVPCPVCGALTGRVHGYGSRTVTDVPVDGRRVVVSLQVRRLVCPAWGLLLPKMPSGQVIDLLEQHDARDPQPRRVRHDDRSCFFAWPISPSRTLSPRYGCYR